MKLTIDRLAFDKKMTFYIVDNFLPCTVFQSTQLVNDNALQRIKAAQRDHVSIDFKQGIARIILPDVTQDVVGENNVRNGSHTQWWATLIADEYNLQPFLYKNGDVFSLVIVSHLGGPVGDVEAVTRRFASVKIF